jgi:hypothetical protein
MERATTERDVDAELAVAAGEPNILSLYFQEVEHPHSVVLQSLAWCLLKAGPANQQLKFATRNGRPPKKNKTEQPITERAAIDAFTFGDREMLGTYLLHSNISKAVQNLLADALSASGTTKQKLVFGRARAGYPDTSLRTQIKRSVFGHLAEDLYKQFGNWPDVDQNLRDRGLLGVDDTARKRAVQDVRKARLRKPPE